MIWLVLAVNTELVTSSGIATISPNAVVFIATEMLADSRAAFSAGFALATAVNAEIRPMIVPSSPSSVAMLEASRATFDFANHKQSGYTMRLIENMCAGRKIITENPRILDEPFYREDRFLLVDGHDFSAVPEFLATPVSSELDVHEFHVDNWAARLIENRELAG